MFFRLAASRAKRDASGVGLAFVDIDLYTSHPNANRYLLVS